MKQNQAQRKKMTYAFQVESGQARDCVPTRSHKVAIRKTFQRAFQRFPNAQVSPLTRFRELAYNENWRVVARGSGITSIRINLRSSRNQRLLIPPTHWPF